MITALYMMLPTTIATAATAGMMLPWQLLTMRMSHVRVAVGTDGVVYGYGVGVCVASIANATVVGGVDGVVVVDADGAASADGVAAAASVLAQCSYFVHP